MTNKKYKKSLKIGCLNVRSLKGEERLSELEEALKNEKIDILGIAVVKREGEMIKETKKGNILCYIGNKGGQKGVGFLIRKKWKNKFVKFKGITDRIASIHITWRKREVSLS